MNLTKVIQEKLPDSISDKIDDITDSIKELQDRCSERTKIIILTIFIIICLLLGVVIINNSRTIKVKLVVEDYFLLNDVKLDESIDIEKDDDVVRFEITGIDPKDQTTSYIITAQKKGKMIIGVEDKEGHRYKYKIYVSENK